MILFPHKTDSAVQKMPYVNFILTGALIIMSLLFYFGKLNGFFIESIIVSKWSVLKAFGSVLIQPDLVSIIFSVLFLFLIGNCLNSVLGNIYYLIFLVACVLVSSIVQGLTSHIPAIGIHGIIIGLSGGAMAILPSNKLLIYKPDSDEETGINIWWLVFLWILFDVYSLMTYLSITNKWTHLACLLTGGGTAFILIKLKLTAPPDATFNEWLLDRISFFTESEFFASLLPTGKTRQVNDEIKKKAEKLIALHEINSEPFLEAPIQQEIIKEKSGLKFRLLKAVKQKDFISLYYVYEGEEITGFSILSEDFKCEIFPSDKLMAGDSGSIKIYSANPDKIDNVFLILKYISGGIPGEKQIAYSSLLNELRTNG